MVVAEHQTAGRGRLGRSWLSPPGAALTFSMLLRPDRVPAARWPWLPLLTGLAVLDGVSAATGVRGELKWPNDVLVHGAKVAGVLLERVEGPAGAAAVVGVGVNVAFKVEELPASTASSLNLELGRDVSRVGLLVAVLGGFADRYTAWLAEAGDAERGLRKAYVAACATVGRDVGVELPGGVRFGGHAVDVDAAGRLVVDAADGRRRLGAADVVHVRPAHPPHMP